MTDQYARALPQELAQSLTELGRDLRKGEVALALLEKVIHGCGNLPLRRFEETGRAIRSLADLHAHPEETSDGAFWRWLWRTPPRVNMKALARTPGINWLFLLHGSGWLREAAVRSLAGRAPSAFWVAILIHRLNDWVPEVREAAAGALDRVATNTPPAVLARACTALLPQMEHWGRWAGEKERVEALVRRADLQGEIVSLLAKERNGPLARVLRKLLVGPEYDHALPLLVRSARQASVRSAALDTLLLGQARWPVGRERKWIDKSFGIWRYEPVFETRRVAPPCSLDELVRLGSRDKAAVVRKVTASALIQRPGLTSILEETARLLAADRNPAVREKAVFILGRLRAPD